MTRWISRAGAVIFVLASVAIVLGLTTSLFPPAPHFPNRVGPSEGGGFAVWPEDTVEEGREACLTRSDTEGWRKTDIDVALRYAEDVLGYPAPYTDQESPPLSEMRWSNVIVYDERMKGIALGTVIATRRFGSCW